MGKPCTTNGGQWPENQRPKQQPGEKTNYTSEDGLVEIITTRGRKFPRHSYEVVVLRLRPKPGTRVVELTDGSGGIEVLLTHREVAEHLRGLNAADDNARYRWRQIPEKPRARREFWRRINARRHS